MSQDFETSFKMLRWMFEDLALPIGDGLEYYQAPGPQEERQAHLLWHVGHAASDLARALIDPYQPDLQLSAPWGDEFRGFNAHLPWPEGPPDFFALIDWYEGLFAAIKTLMPRYQRSLVLPVDLGDRQVRTAREAWDYVLFHTGFHLGRCHQLLDW
ncbi:MAG: hypothetical protein RRB13_15360 [bacterium]|nr:hypothetical protein [bacterium]